MTVTMTTGLVPIHHLPLENIRGAKLRAKWRLIEEAMKNGYAEPSWGESSWSDVGRDATPADWMGGSVSNISPSWKPTSEGSYALQDVVVPAHCFVAFYGITVTNPTHRSVSKLSIYKGEEDVDSDPYYEVRHYHLHALYAVKDVEVTTEESLSATKVSYVGEGFFVEPVIYKQRDQIKVELQINRQVVDNWCPVILNGYVLDVKRG